MNTNQSNDSFNYEYKEQLSDELTSLVGDRKSESHHHTTLECIDIVLKYDDVITSCCNQYCISKSLVQSILFRELWHFNDENIVAENLVKAYFDWKERCDERFRLTPLGCCEYICPEPPKVMLEDCPTGIGQITASTAIDAFNSAIDNCLITSIKSDMKDWRSCKSVWYSLHNNDSFCIRMIIFTLRHCAETEEIFGELYNCNKKQIKAILLRYKNFTEEAIQYFKECYGYYKIFKKYT